MPAPPRPVSAHYSPRGRCRDLFPCDRPEVLLSGPAGTGKSLACLFKLHFCATRVPGLRALIVRKTRVSLTDSALVTFERDVLPAPPDGAGRANRHAYAYPNGSEVVIGGMDRATKVMSAEYDLIYAQEATELEEAEWEALSSRLRNGRLPYQQLLADCNPDAPTHWLKKRCDAGRTLMLETRHENNPRLWDAAAGRWTPFGLAYLAKLDALTGNRKLRLRHGRWVQAEGVVYEDWDAGAHIVDRFAAPADWPRYWSFDFGFTDPFVWQSWAKDPEGRLYLDREVYCTGRLVEDHARRINALAEREPRPQALVCDHDREGRATLEKYLGRATLPAPKAIDAGIQLVAARLKASRQDGRPRLFLMRGALDRRDPVLDESKRPGCTAEEFDGYVWDTEGGRRKGGRRKGEVPVDKDNHGMDALRYLVAYLDRGQDWGLRAL